MDTTLPTITYFDNAAANPMLPAAARRIHELNLALPGNSSSPHRAGRQSKQLLDECHEKLGSYFHVPPTHVVFTSGGTESNNLALWGALGGLVDGVQWMQKKHSSLLITSKTEHDATKKVFEAFEQLGGRVQWLGVDQEGFLNIDELAEVTRERTKLLSTHHVQNETGVIQDISKISRTVHANNPDALIHIDAIQSFLRIKINLEEMGVDMVSIGGHKIGGPKGVGALILGRRFHNRDPKLGAFMAGANQQFGIRPGTVCVQLICGMMTAIEYELKELEKNTAKIAALKNHFIQTLPNGAVVNGSETAPHIVNFSVPGMPSAAIVEALSDRGFCIASGAACNSTNPKPNQTILEMGLGIERALSSVRASFSANNTIEEVDRFQSALREVIDGRY